MKIESNGAPHYNSARRQTVPTHGQIAAEAEVLWRQRGCPHGLDEEIWLEAERVMERAMDFSMDDGDTIALADPLSRLDRNSDDVMGELEELFPQPTGRETTAL